MRVEAGCPEDDTLVRFLAGRIGEAEREHIAGHVDACSACAFFLTLPKSETRTASDGERQTAVPRGSLSKGAVLADRYRILRPIGTGGMGEVYEAFDLTLNEPLALKTVRAAIADDPRAVELLKSEVQL